MLDAHLTKLELLALLQAVDEWLLQPMADEEREYLRSARTKVASVLERMTNAPKQE